MSWYYAKDGQRVGPVNEAEFARLVGDGRITPATLVWRSGLPDWRPYAEVASAAPASPGIAPEPEEAAKTGRCSHCARVFQAEVLESFEGSPICPDCLKVEQASYAPGSEILREEAPAEEELLARDYAVDMDGWVLSGVKLVLRRFGLVLGAVLMMNLAIGLPAMIPFLGILLVMVLTGPYTAGLFTLLAKAHRGEAVAIRDLFVAFSRGAKDTMKLGAILSGLYVPGGVLLQLGQAADNPYLQIGGFCFYLIALPVWLYCWVNWVFAFPLMIEREMDFRSAIRLSSRIVGKHFYGMLGFQLFLGVITALGILCALPVLIVAALVAALAPGAAAFLPVVTIMGMVGLALLLSSICTSAAAAAYVDLFSRKS